MKRVNTEALRSLNKTKLKLESFEERDSVMTTVYRSNELFPVDQVKITCSSTIELCGLRLTKKEGKRTRYIERETGKTSLLPNSSEPTGRLSVT
jgi:hypothetical protein